MVDGHEYYLVRMEGFHKHHNNKFEKKEKKGVQFVAANTYHVHRITERYQKLALAMPAEFEELEYAEPTPWFNNADSAFTYFRDYCHIVCIDPNLNLNGLFSSSLSMTSTNVAAIKKSICDSIRCTDDAELGMVHIDCHLRSVVVI